VLYKRGMPDSAAKQLADKLTLSRIFQDYEEAYSGATGMPVSFRPEETWQLAHHRSKHQNPFCMLMAETSRSCAACLEVQQGLNEKAQQQPATISCFAGLCDSAVPVRVGDKLFGYLQTGQVLTTTPTKKQFARTTQQLIDWGSKVDLGKLEEAYFHTRVLKPKQYDAMVRLLGIFAKHLAMVANQIVVQEQNAEPPMITRAKEFIKANQGEDISLGDVAKSVNTSTFYFCKMFKKATGLNFTDYLSRIRIEKAKNLLLNPNLRISEIAYEVGFQSLTHFNRVFRKLAGQSPTEYRQKLPGMKPH
jgi:AraC-like DNA-binding protein/ligand-binding sensor protein